MSSFTISKKEYIKAAGLLAGISEEKKDHFFLYDYKNNCRFTDAGLMEAMTDCFEMNSISVYEQYSPRHEDEVLHTDNNDYIDIFKEYKKKGRAAAIWPETLKKCIFELNQFFQSAIYQTEKEAYEYKMMFLFGRIISALIPCIKGGYECQSWGELDISQINAENIETIF